MRVGLVGLVGPEADLLWAAHPFASWLRPPHPTFRFGDIEADLAEARRAGRHIYEMAGCHKVIHQFLYDLDAVVMVHRCWPPQLAYWAGYVRGQRVVLVAHDYAYHDRTSYWFRYANLVVAPTVKAMQRVGALDWFGGPVEMCDLGDARFWDLAAGPGG